MTEAQKAAAKARYKREGGIGKNRKRKTASRKRAAPRRAASYKRGPSRGKGSERPSVLKYFVTGATVASIAVATGIGVTYVAAVQGVVMEYAAMLGIATGAGIAALVLGLFIASRPSNRNVPIVGFIGRGYASALASLGWKP